KGASGPEAHIPLKPFNGTMGVAVNTQDKPNSIPPGPYAGNLDINELSVGAVLYIPVQVDGALFYASDPHFAQGDGEVALTAIEGSLRSAYRLTVLKAGDKRLPMKAPMKNPFAETKDYWIPIGLNTDLDDAMKDATRQTVQFLNEKLGMDRATALAYASAGVDFQVSQVVDRGKADNAISGKPDSADNRAKKQLGEQMDQPGVGGTQHRHAERDPVPRERREVVRRDVAQQPAHAQESRGKGSNRADRE